MSDITANEKMKALTDMLEQGTKDVFESERYKEYLGVMAKFHRYSSRNSLLILLQNPDASHVAGFGAWKSMGRSVNKGEKGIQILAPAPYQKRVEVTRDENGKLLPEPQTKEVTVTAFRPAYVFDVSQTKGKELPRLVEQLMGSVPEHDKMMRCLREVSPCPIQFEGSMRGKANGYYEPTKNYIAIRMGISEEQTIKTMIHEIAHAKLGHGNNPTMDRRTEEVQAESVAYVVCQHFGIDSSQYSFGYIAGWSKDKELPQLQSSLEVIQKTARGVIDCVDERITALRHEQEKNIAQEQTVPVKVQEQAKDVGYKTFYSGADGQDREAHDFQKETGWNMAWGTDSSGLNGDTWIVYRSVEDLPRQLKSIVPKLEHEQIQERSSEVQPAPEKMQEAVKEPKQVKRPQKPPIAERLDAAKKECSVREAAASTQEHAHKRQKNMER